MLFRQLLQMLKLATNCTIYPIDWFLIWAIILQGTEITAPSYDTEDPKYTLLVSNLKATAVEAVNQAVEAQDNAANAIKSQFYNHSVYLKCYSLKQNKYKFFFFFLDHVQMVLKSLEMIYEPGQTPENVWEPVFQATMDKLEAVKAAEVKAKEARCAVALLKETVAHGLKHDHSVHSPDLITLDESVARALYRY